MEVGERPASQTTQSYTLVLANQYHRYRRLTSQDNFNQKSSNAINTNHQSSMPHCIGPAVGAGGRRHRLNKQRITNRKDPHPWFLPPLFRFFFRWKHWYRYYCVTLGGRNAVLKYVLSCFSSCCCCSGFLCWYACLIRTPAGTAFLLQYSRK